MLTGATLSLTIISFLLPLQMAKTRTDLTEGPNGDTMEVKINANKNNNRKRADEKIFSAV